MIGYFFKQIKIALWHLVFWHWRTLVALLLALTLSAAFYTGVSLGCYELLREKIEVRDGLRQHSHISLQEICVEGSKISYTVENKSSRRYHISNTIPVLQVKAGEEWQNAPSAATAPVRTENIDRYLEPESSFRASQEYSHVALEPGEYRLLYANCAFYNERTEKTEYSQTIYIVGYFSIP